MLALPVKIVEGVGWVLQAIGLFAVGFMALTICYDAMMRYLFAAPTSWSLEVNSYLVVYLAVMTAADVHRRGEHIAITLWPESAGPATRRVLRVITAVVGIILCSILAWRGYLMSHDAFRYGERVSSAFGTPTWIPYAMLPIGFTTLALQFLINAFRDPKPAQDDGVPSAVL
ncbi:TRAP transporter small permease [Acuticoccus sediminis]|uniref:TRAP transporter small permease protein n=1 Tax=Acuticoccus sediminis TaxID=2184697 RepID=A0A8B2NQ53_9HYPH|nr:TRAP transporter small permease [Acuticoccus sediminis]RAH99141.1 TRAP transporter small permease [Acuticoccus sediminis]